MKTGRIMRILLLLALLLVIARWRVKEMFYFPDSVVYDTPASHGLKYEPVRFASRDGTRLSGWFMPAVGAPKGTVIHFHGNAQNMTAHFAFVSWLPVAGFNLFVFDYRGYGESEGTPNRRGVYEDSQAALQYVRSRRDIDPAKLFTLGQSLGGAVSIAVVGDGNKQGIRAVVADSAFFSYQGIVRDVIGTMPLLAFVKSPLSKLLISNDLSPADYIGRIAPIPILLIHGSADQVVPFQHGTWLMERAGQPKTFWRIEGGNHTEALLSPDSPYRRRLTDFLEAAVR